MTNKEYNELKNILGESTKTYSIVTKKLAESLKYRKMDRFEKWKEYLSEVVRQNSIWKDEVQKVLNKTKQGKEDFARVLSNLHACPDEREDEIELENNIEEE